MLKYRLLPLPKPSLSPSPPSEVLPPCLPLSLVLREADMEEDEYTDGGYSEYSQYDEKLLEYEGRQLDYEEKLMDYEESKGGAAPQ